jgi:tetratricopeptide (TPR) repeat protein
MKDELLEEVDRLVNTGDIETAISRLKQAGRLSPRQTLELGRLLTITGELPEGQRLLAELAESEHVLPEACFYLGFNLEKQNRLEEAAEQLSKGLDRREWGPALTVLGEVYRRLGRRSEALSSFERASELDEGDSEALYGRGLVTSEFDTDEALTLFRRAVEADSHHGAAYRELGRMQWRKSDLDGAESSLRQAVRLSPHDVWAKIYLGQVLLLNRQFEEAANLLQAAVDLWPEVILAHVYLGDALVNLGRHSEAEASFRRALAIDLSSFLANLRYGQFLAHRHKNRKAEKYLSRAQAINPSDGRAQKALARLPAK